MLAILKRMKFWLIATGVLLAFVAWIAPQQFPVLAYKLVLVTIGVIATYVADRALFLNAPQIKSGMQRDLISAARIIGRALIALAVIQGLTQGL
ncbi:MAG: hypothetical protein JW395_3195 [Nitrospira sp.]|nr:hypothetical protein [Nitrospira sp.]